MDAQFLKHSVPMNQTRPVRVLSFLLLDSLSTKHKEAAAPMQVKMTTEFPF